MKDVETRPYGISMTLERTKPRECWRYRVFDEDGSPLDLIYHSLDCFGINCELERYEGMNFKSEDEIKKLKQRIAELEVLESRLGPDLARICSRIAALEGNNTEKPRKGTKFNCS